jgi:hypothetical protein
MTHAYLDRGTGPASRRRVLWANGVVLGLLVATGLLALALVCLGCSVGIDLVADRMHLDLAGYTFVEDGLKLAGILNWVLVVAPMADSRVRALMAPPAEGAVRPFEPGRPARPPRAEAG